MADSLEPTEAEVDAVIVEFKGDPRAAIRALLHDLGVLARDGAIAISRGYVRGRWPASDPPSPDGKGSGASLKRTGES